MGTPTAQSPSVFPRRRSEARIEAVEVREVREQPDQPHQRERHERADYADQRRHRGEHHDARISGEVAERVDE